MIEASRRFPKPITNPRIMTVCSAKMSNILVKTKHDRLFNTIRVDRQSKSYKETCSLVTKAIRVGCGGGAGGCSPPKLGKIRFTRENFLKEQ